MTHCLWIACLTVALLSVHASVSPGPLLAEPQGGEKAGEPQRAPTEQSRAGTPERSLKEQHRERDALLREEERLVEKVEEIEGKLAAEKDPEQARRLRGELAAVVRQIDKLGPQIEKIDFLIGENEALPGPLQQQLDQLYVAADNLLEAGMDREADRLIAEADALIAEHGHVSRREQAPPRPERRMDDLADEVLHLRQEIEELRAEIDELYEILESALGDDASFAPENGQVKEGDDTSSGS